MTSDFDFSAEILFMDIREYLPTVDPDNLTQANVLEILLYLMNQKNGFDCSSCAWPDPSGPVSYTHLTLPTKA